MKLQDTLYKNESEKWTRIFHKRKTHKKKEKKYIIHNGTGKETTTQKQPKRRRLIRNVSHVNDPLSQG